MLNIDRLDLPGPYAYRYLSRSSWFEVSRRMVEIGGSVKPEDTDDGQTFPIIRATIRLIEWAPSLHIFVSVPVKLRSG